MKNFTGAEPKTMKMNISIQQDLYEKIVLYATENDLNLSQVVRLAIRKFFKNQENE